jgi:hypothetical protein
MMSEPEVLWRKETQYFIVEIKVGNTWVEHGREQVESLALKAGSEALKDSSVSAVRILGHALSQVCSNIWEEKALVIMKIPPRMTYTGRTQICPKCAVEATVASDGTTDWIFCGKCDAAFPA